MALISAISPWDTLNWGLKLPTVKGLRVLPADQRCSFSLFPVAGQGERPSGALVSPTPGTTWAPNPPVCTCWAAGTPFPIPPAPTRLAPLSPSFLTPSPACLVGLRPRPARRPGLPQGVTPSPAPSTKIAPELPELLPMGGRAGSSACKMHPWAARECNPLQGSRVGDRAGGESLIRVRGAPHWARRRGWRWGAGLLCDLDQEFGE